jgi:hypothetical protein
VYKTVQDKPLYQCPACKWQGADYHRPPGELPRCPLCRRIVHPLVENVGDSDAVRQFVAMVRGR